MEVAAADSSRHTITITSVPPTPTPALHHDLTTLSFHRTQPHQQHQQNPQQQQQQQQQPANKRFQESLSSDDEALCSCDVAAVAAASDAAVDGSSNHNHNHLVFVPGSPPDSCCIGISPPLSKQDSSSGCSSGSSSPVLTDGIAPEAAAGLLQGSTATTITTATTATTASAVLFIDVRSQLSFATGHVCGAINATSSVLQLRRLDAGKLSVENIFSAKHRKAFRDAKENPSTCIIVYDDQCDLPPSGPLPTGGGLLSVLLRRIAEDHANVHYLSGGFSKFESLYPCMVETCTAPPVPLVLPGWDESKMRMPAAGLSASMPMCMAAPPPTPSSLPPTRVEDYLYLGTQEDSKNLALLESLNIRYILNVTPDCLNHFDSIPGYNYMRIPIKDTWNQNIAASFDSSFQFIEQARAEGAAVLVHCMAGISRSATIVIAYLMRKHHTSMNATYNMLKAKRCTISPNLDFMGHLLQFERMLGIEHDSDDSPMSPEPSSSMMTMPLVARC